ncbi:MAG: type II toxin-antitoxin system PemK/MazF family toxin [Ilumatobacter sp.]|nr:type II toxin-antitoxin system PemK/MazF family toxin [Ilumatobacter sp.]
MTKWANILLKLFRQVQAARREYERGTGKPTKKSAPRTKRVESGVRIEYTPDVDGDPDPGEVVWTWVPYEDDPQRGKDRPVVIIGRTGDDLAGVQLTSKGKGRRDQVAVGTGAWDPKRRPSYAKVDRLLTIDPDDVRREGAVLARDRFDEVVDNVAEYHDIARR